MKASTTKKALIQRITQHLIPAFVEDGFAERSLSPEDTMNVQMRAAFPFGSFYRKRGELLDLIEIQFDKHSRPSFVINAGVAPPDGSSFFGKTFSQEHTPIAALPEWYRLYNSAQTDSWFEVSRAVFWADMEAHILSPVTMALERYIELQTWFLSGTVGSHMKRIGYPARS